MVLFTLSRNISGRSLQTIHSNLHSIPIANIQNQTFDNMPIETIESASQPRNAQFFHTESIANGGKSDQTFSYVSIRRFLVISFLRNEGENESSPVVFEMSHLTHFFVLSFQFINASEPSLEQQSNPGALSLIGRNAMCQGLVTGEQITNDLFHGNLANRRRHR